MLPQTEKVFKEIVRLVGEAKESAVLDYEATLKDLEVWQLKYKAMCVVMNKVHNALVAIGELAEDEKAHYLIINLKQDEDEIEAQAN